MSRPISQLRHPHSRLPMMTVASALLLASVFTPASWLEAIQILGNPIEKLLIPVQAPVRGAVSWLVGRVRPEAESPAIAEARADARAFKTMYLQSLDENARLREQVEALQKGLALNPDAGVRLLLAPVVGEHGGSSKVLKVRAGGSSGVARGDVAAFDGVHLVGRVMGDPDAAFCRVLLITDAASGAQQNTEGKGRITGVIIAGETDLTLPADPAAERFRCTLSPGNGVLSGRVSSASPRADRPGPRVEVGAIVRLSDDRWPASAQMLILGRVQRVETKPTQHQEITVAPMYDPSLIREVTIRLEGDGKPAAGPGAAP